MTPLLTQPTEMQIRMAKARAAIRHGHGRPGIIKHGRPSPLAMEKAYELAEHQALLLNRAYAFNCAAWLEKEVKTRDEHDRENPIKPFPMKPYVAPMIDVFDREKTTFIIKSRQMVNTWLCCGYGLHTAQFFGHRLVLIISEKFEKSAALVDRIRFMYLNQAEWLKTLNPLDRQMRDQPIGTLSFACGSKILALPEGPDQVRMHTASLIIIDEADFHLTFKKTYEACLPSIAGGGKLIALSTINPGEFSKTCGIIE